MEDLEVSRSDTESSVLGVGVGVGVGVASRCSTRSWAPANVAKGPQDFHPYTKTSSFLASSPRPNAHTEKAWYRFVQAGSNQGEEEVQERPACHIDEP